MKKVIEKAIEGGWKPMGFPTEGLKLFTQTKTLFWLGKTQKGGFMVHAYAAVLDRLFWEGLARKCRWVAVITSVGGGKSRVIEREWEQYALQFHQINLKEGWSAAVAYLEKLIKN